MDPTTVEEREREEERAAMQRAEERLVTMGYEHVEGNVWRRCRPAPRPLVAETDWDAVLIHIAPLARARSPETVA